MGLARGRGGIYRGRRITVAVVLIFAIVLGGCIAGDRGEDPLHPGGGGGDGDADPEPGASGSTPTTGSGQSGAGGSAAGGSGGSSGGGSENGTTGGNNTEPGGESGSGTGGGENGTSPPSDDPWAGEEEPSWPAPAQAAVRPGVQVVVGTMQCTSNFLFRDFLNGTLYLGTAAHCVDGARLGQSASIRDADGQLTMRGYVAYSSWWSIGFKPDPSGVGDDLHPHDFALIRIPDDERHRVHPAVLHYGGPTGIADWGLVAPLDRVIVYGNSGMRPGGDLLNEQEGYVLAKRAAEPPEGPGHAVITHTFAPPLPGDSGSGLMTKDGKALGALSAVYAGTPYGAWWEYSSVPHALAHLQNEGWHLQLATADLAQNGLLP